MELSIKELSASKRPRLNILDDNKSSETKTTSETETVSAPNILDILNDYCLQEIFKRIGIIDLSNATRVCKRFQQNAEEIFSLCHEKNFRLVSLTLVKAKVLRNFVHLMKSVYLKGKQANNFLGVFNDQSLIESLHLRRANIAVNKLKPLLSKLTSLDISNCTFLEESSDMFACYSKLEYLKVKLTNLPPSPYKLQNLKKFEYDSYEYTDHLRWFIEQNPQLTSIAVATINTLKVPTDFNTHLVEFGKFKTLTSLKLPCYQFCVTPLIRSLCDNKIPMQQLELIDCRIDDESFRGIFEMKSIKILTLTGIGALSRNLFVELAKELPQLEVLRLETANKYNNRVTMDDVNIFVQESKNLLTLTVGVIREKTIDRNSFDQLLQFVAKDERKTLTIAIIYDNNKNLFPSKQAGRSNKKKIRILNIKCDEYNYDDAINACGSDDSDSDDSNAGDDASDGSGDDSNESDDDSNERAEDAGETSDIISLL